MGDLVTAVETFAPDELTRRLPARLAFRLMRVLDEIEPVLRRYEEQRQQLLEKYAQPEPDQPGFITFVRNLVRLIGSAWRCSLPSIQRCWKRW